MLVIISSILLYVSVYDLYYKKISNTVSLIIAILGFINHFLLMGSTGLTVSLYGLSTGFFVTLFFYRFTGLGAGDVKLIAAIGCFVGYPSILFVIAYSYVVSAFLSIFYIKLWLPWWNQRQATNLAEPKPEKILSQRIPMAPGISIATFYILLGQPF